MARDDDDYHEVEPTRALAQHIEDNLMFEPLRDEPEEIARWAAWELANFVDIRLQISVDPAELDTKARRATWVQRALDDGDGRIDEPFVLGRRPYWLLENGERVGTIAFWFRRYAHVSSAEIQSVYVHPNHRRKGIGSKALLAMRDAAFAVGAKKVEIGATWTSTPSLLFYLSHGMWIRSWKHAVNFYFLQGQAGWQVEVSGDKARFILEGRALVEAERKIDDKRRARLSWTEVSPMEQDLKWDVEGTFAVWLGAHGWPLIRSDEQWQSQLDFGFSDCGDCEGLAFRSRQFERYARQQGWHVPQRNPSLLNEPKVASAELGPEVITIRLDDQRTFVFPVELVGEESYVPTPISSVTVSEDGEEIICKLTTGEDDRVSLDHVVWLHQSPEHFQETVDQHRRFRQQLEAQKAKKKGNRQ